MRPFYRWKQREGVTLSSLHSTRKTELGRGHRVFPASRDDPGGLYSPQGPEHWKVWVSCTGSDVIRKMTY